MRQFRQNKLELYRKSCTCVSQGKEVHMDTLSNSGIPGIIGRHPPRHSVPRCYATSSCTHRNGILQLTGLTASPAGKNTRLSMKIPTIHFGEAPFCQFLVPRIERDGNPRTPSAKRPLCRTSTMTPLPVTPVALSKDQPGHQETEKISAEHELSTSFTQIAPHYSGPGSEVKNGRPLLKSTTRFDGGYERAVIHREMVSRLKEVEAATADEISDPGYEPLRSADSPDVLGNSLAVEDATCLLPLKRKIGRSLIETGKQQLECAHNQGRKETRRGVLKHCLPPLLDRLGSQFPLEIFPDRQSCQRAARVNVSSRLSYGLEKRDYGLDVMEELDIDMLDGIGNLRSNSYHPRQTAVFARSMDYRMSSTQTTSMKMGSTTGERMSRMGLGQFGGSRSGRVLDDNSHVYVGSGRTLRYKSRTPMPAQNGTDGRLWLRADSGVESPENLCTSLLTIVGLVAFVVSGTYAFAVSQQCLKSGQWFRKASCEPVTVARPAPETQPKPLTLKQTNVPEITDENFVDTIKKRSTFVLFYANWCPYCEKLDPTWNALGDILSNKGYDVQLVRMNAEMHPNTAKNFKVVKYPTLILFKGGVAADNYLGPRTVNAMMEFIDANLRN